MAFCSSSSATGSGRSGAGVHPVCTDGGTCSRAALPRALRSSTLGCTIAVMSVARRDFVAATAAKGPSRSRACSDVVAKSTCSPSSSMRRAINGSEPSRRNFLRSDAVGESVTASRTAMSDSAHAAGLPRNANTSCTHTPYPRVHRDLPCRRRRTFTFPGRCRIARLRNTRTVSPAAHNQSGTPRIARIAQITVTPSRSHRLPQPNHRRAAGDIPIRQGPIAPAECG